MTIVPNIEMSLLKGTPNLLVDIEYIDESLISEIGRSLLLSDFKLTAEPARGDALEVTAPGFYEVRPEGQGQAPETVVAANVDLSESDLAGVDPAEIATVVAGNSTAQAATGSAVEPPRDEVTEQSQRLWWYLLLAGMLLLIAESLVASRMSKAAT
jgi:hypothetical protein